MMNRTKAISQITEARFQAELAKLRALSAAEAAIRTDIARLNAQRLAAQAQFDGEVSLRALGADSLWQSWLNRNLTALNMRLANTMAQKLESLDACRAAFGRNQAAEELNHRQLEHDRQSHKKADLDKLQDWIACSPQL